jgi:hypothetical protein
MATLLTLPPDTKFRAIGEGQSVTLKPNTFAGVAAPWVNCARGTVGVQSSTVDQHDTRVLTKFTPRNL